MRLNDLQDGLPEQVVAQWIARVDGEFRLESRSGEGLKVSADIPVRPSAREVSGAEPEVKAMVK